MSEDTKMILQAIQEVKEELHNEVQKVKADLSGEIQKVKEDLSGEIQKVKEDLSSEIQEIRADIADLKQGQERIEKMLQKHETKIEDLEMDMKMMKRILTNQ